MLVNESIVVPVPIQNQTVSVSIHNPFENLLTKNFSFSPCYKVIWTKGNRQLDSNPRYLINSSGLIIKDAITDDDGGLFRISALVTETGATHEKRITVQIYGINFVDPK